jgi:TrpR family trp operon transcriptional repressor
MSEKKLLDEFIEQVLSYKDKKSLDNFMSAILTPKELEEIPTRLKIIKMLKNGVTQRDISNKLGVGIATITRGSKELQKNSFSELD